MVVFTLWSQDGEEPAVIHEVDPARKDQPNRWFGGDTCQCVCGCGFLALGDFFGEPLCNHCQNDDWPDSEAKQEVQ